MISLPLFAEIDARIDVVSPPRPTFGIGLPIACGTPTLIADANDGLVRGLDRGLVRDAEYASVHRPVSSFVTPAYTETCHQDFEFHTFRFRIDGRLRPRGSIRFADRCLGRSAPPDDDASPTRRLFCAGENRTARPSTLSARVLG
ncbi:MAG: hypothetical protein KA144_16745 [Xanthomonadaceae bacterium]|nr:hypothetical protein [Xanthomonadaceae bacterium]